MSFFRDFFQQAQIAVEEVAREQVTTTTSTSPAELTEEAIQSLVSNHEQNMLQIF
jgi:hypothetical protein